jgi:enoyl-CoA hydratase
VITSSVTVDGVAEVIIDNPPVNALPAVGWSTLAATLTDLGADPAVRVVVLRAEGRGFNAGVDLKELQRTTYAKDSTSAPQGGTPDRVQGDAKDSTSAPQGGTPDRVQGEFTAIVAVNRGCADAFAAVYDCPVPVIAAVHGYCLGGGIGLVGNADIIVASEDATFGLPEVDRGALGAATHLSRLVPQHRMRALMYTAGTATAAELHQYGSVLRVVPRAELRSAALDIARQIAAKDPTVIRAAKACLNGIDPADVKRSYRYEQGYTFELNLAGVADRLRDGFGR